jgi:DNA gyrase subunit A
MTDNLIPTNLATQVKEDYMDYAMAVLVGRAIPDLYDGLKPVQRRVLQTMLEEGLTPDKRFVKCARVTGMAMAYYHPHSGAYGALVNMATPWSNNVPWVDGHGNFGSSVDGPAAERYTECKLRPSAVDLLLQDRATWETRPNYDGSRQEATRFNSAVPAVLLNGDMGIAVGFSTRLAPHNLRSVVAATKLACSAKANAASIAKARQTLVPDFPTGCEIVEDEQLAAYIQTGSGSIRCRARFETGVQKRDGRAKDRPTVTFTNFPPNVNPESLGEQIRDALEKGKIDGIAEVIDESDLSGDRVSVVAKPGVDIDLLVGQLFATTHLDTKYSAKTLVIDGCRPVELSPVEVCQRWFEWRLGCLEGKFGHELDLAECRLEIVMGFLKAIDKIDEVIKTIRASSSKKTALIALVDRPFKFTRDQAEAILEMRLRQLTNLDTTELETERGNLVAEVEKLAGLVKDKGTRSTWLLAQLTTLAERHGEARRSPVVPPPAGPAPSPTDRGPRPATGAPKPRFLKVQNEKSVVEQVKGPRGALVLLATEKLVVVGEDGLVAKVSAKHKGPVFDHYTPCVLAKREADLTEKRYLVVFTLGDQLKAMMLSGEDLCRTTSKGKRYLPEEAKLVHFGEGPFTVPFVSTRKKKVELFPLTTKAAKPGAKGVKVAHLDEVAL